MLMLTIRIMTIMTIMTIMRRRMIRETQPLSYDNKDDDDNTDDGNDDDNGDFDYDNYDDNDDYDYDNNDDYDEYENTDDGNDDDNGQGDSATEETLHLQLQASQRRTFPQVSHQSYHYYCNHHQKSASA